MNSIGDEFLQTAMRRVRSYKELGDRTFAQLEEADFHIVPAIGSNSLAIIIRHISGNILSRWTNFLAEDGEKAWRDRDAEFASNSDSKQALLDAWEKGWSCYLDALALLNAEDLLKTVFIRNEPLTVMDAINRQLAHYPYHVGQIVYLGRMIKKEAWKNLSIPPGMSQQYNQQSGPKDPARKY